MTAQEKIFCNTMIDLRKRFELCTEYDILKASGLIRQLLVDNYPLVELINKNYKLKIVYKVQKRFETPFERKQEDGTVWKALYAITFISPKDSLDVELLKKDEFLKYNLLFYNHENFSVLEIIKICANKYGGIHYDETKNLKESSIEITHKHFNLNDSSSVIQSMYSITEICLNALNPLFEKIESSYKS